MVRIWYETTETGATWGHIESDSGVIGNAKYIKETFQSGAYLSIPPKYKSLTKWLIKHCGFIFILSHPVDGESEPSDILVKGIE